MSFSGAVVAVVVPVVVPVAVAGPGGGVAVAAVISTGVNVDAGAEAVVVDPAFGASLSLVEGVVEFLIAVGALVVSL